MCKRPEYWRVFIDDKLYRIYTTRERLQFKHNFPSTLEEHNIIDTLNISLDKCEQTLCTLKKRTMPQQPATDNSNMRCLIM